MLISAVITLFPQNTVRTLSFTNDSSNHRRGEIVDFGNNEAYSLYSKFIPEGVIQVRVKYFLSKSSDGGDTWQTPRIVCDTIFPASNVSEDSLGSPYLLKGANNRLLLFFKGGLNNYYYYKYSDNGGSSWTPNLSLKTGISNVNSAANRITSAVYLGNNKIILGISNSTTTMGTIRSNDNGTSFTAYLSFGSGVYVNPSILSQGNGNFVMAYQQSSITTNNRKIILVRYDATLSQYYDVTTAYESSEIITYPKLYSDNSGNIFIFYTQISRAFSTYKKSNFFYIKSSNNGVSWQSPVQVTKYGGVDEYMNLNPQSVRPLFIFSSIRNTPNGITTLHWGDGLLLDDVNSAPIVYEKRYNSNNLVSGDSIFIKVFTGSSAPFISASLTGLLNGNLFNVNLFDDGMNKDSLAGDMIYGGFIKIAEEGDLYNFKIKLTTAYQTFTSMEYSISIPINDLPSVMALHTGRLIVPFNNSGVIADVSVPEGYRLRFDSIPAIYSHGFMLSGLTNSGVWATGILTASRINDFQPGLVGSVSTDPRNGIYSVSIKDSAFGASWQKWKFAVQVGARYWDGNNNGIYDPIDYNNNGIWDINEDMPEILGEVSYYTVFNDGISRDLRRFFELPKGIEIRQTIYAFPSSDSPALRDAVFIRYEISKKGNISSDINDLIFAIQTDPDLGDSYDDLVMTDSLRNSIVCYNDGDDAQFGTNPPAIYNTMLFGQPMYIPGISFTDVNNNGRYDSGIDIDIDTATIPMGKPFSNLKYPGAINSGIRATQHYLQSHPTHGDPSNSIEARNYHEGRNRIGQFLNSCTWAFGQVLGGVDCSLVDPVYVYSGDPVMVQGWINNSPNDQRIIAASNKIGVFSENNTLTYHTSIVMARGTSALNSITMTQFSVDTIFNKMGAKYTYVPTSIIDDLISQSDLPTVFELFQNYPNPFNPSTVISYALPASGEVSLILYDLLGREVKALVNGMMPAGKHEVEFNANNFSSGVYFYVLKTGGKQFTKKLVIMK
jgi:hypothetical protein